MVGICHLTDSHHNHHGQKPTMVGICHGGNMLGNHLTLLADSEEYFISHREVLKPRLVVADYRLKI